MVLFVLASANLCNLAVMTVKILVFFVAMTVISSFLVPLATRGCIERIHGDLLEPSWATNMERELCSQRP